MTAVEQAQLTHASPDVAGDQARAERVAAERRHRRALINLVIRLVSLASALALWEVAAWNVDPVLFTSPSKVAVAAYQMILSGELWTYLWPSLVVLAMPFAWPRNPDAVRSDPRFTEIRLHIWHELHAAKPRNVRAPREVA